jgi:hypothetical protein
MTMSSDDPMREAWAALSGPSGPSTESLWRAVRRRLYEDPYLRLRATATARLLLTLRQPGPGREFGVGELEDDAHIAALALIVAEQLDPGPGPLAEAWARGAVAGASYRLGKPGDLLPPNPYVPDRPSE